MTVIYIDQLNTPGVLRAFFYEDGVLTDPYLVQYTITGPDNLPVTGQLDKLALRNATGEYYIDWQTGKQQPLGIYSILWTYQKTSADMLQSGMDEFNVIMDLSEEAQAIHIPSGSGMGTSPGGNGAGNSCDAAAGFVLRDFFGRIKTFSI